jgi:DNA polymerase-3 subunit epsilon
MILFFDTETTGLPKNWKAPITDLENWPRLVQIAYLVYDFDGNLIHSCNEIIKPNGFTIPKDASKIHGITAEIATRRGSNIEDVFEIFSIHLKRAKVIVAHNMAYDEKIIGSELIRMGLDNILDSKEKICTMESTVDLCKIGVSYGYKWPKLEEIHRFLFKHDFEDAHDALADIQATAKCFWELKKIGVIKLLQNYRPSNFNSTIEKFKEYSMLNENKYFDVPFLTIDREGEESWILYNTKLEIKHHTIEYQDILDVMNSRIKGEENLWNNIFYLINPWKSTFINPVYNNEELWIDKWMDWELIGHDQIYYKGEFILEIQKLFSISWNQKTSKIKGFKFYNSENNITKIIAHYRHSSDTSGFIDTEEELVIEEYYFTLFYIHQDGSVFIENNLLEFDPLSCVPFLKINKEGDSSWQFYNNEKDLFFGKIFENHYEVEKEIKSTIYNKSTYFWETSYDQKELIELDEWKGWKIKSNGDLFFYENFKINIFDLNLDFDNGYIMDSESNISKLITEYGDCDEFGVFGWHTTLFYIDEKGGIYLENN